MINQSVNRSVSHLHWTALAPLPFTLEHFTIMHVYLFGSFFGYPWSFGFQSWFKLVGFGLPFFGLFCCSRRYLTHVGVLFVSEVPWTFVGLSWMFWILWFGLCCMGLSSHLVCTFQLPSSLWVSLGYAVTCVLVQSCLLFGSSFSGFWKHTGQVHDSRPFFLVSRHLRWAFPLFVVSFTLWHFLRLCYCA